MISLHDPEENPSRLHHDWFFPWSKSPMEWGLGQTTSWPFSLTTCAQAICAYPWSPSRYLHGYRNEQNFLSADIVALDFDEGMTLETALETFGNMKHIIATTRNHQRQKGKKPPCDRFRVLLFLAHTFTDLSTYKSLLAAYVELHGSDKQAKDGARLFFPCREIISVKEGFSCPVIQKKEAPRTRAPLKDQDVSLERINQGSHTFKGSTERNVFDSKRDPTTKKGCRAWIAGAGGQDGNRNVACFQAAGDLFEAGWDEDSVISWLLKIGTTLTHAEVLARVRSAQKKKRGF
jgi:hypothetical protein